MEKQTKKVALKYQQKFFLSPLEEGKGKTE